MFQKKFDNKLKMMLLIVIVLLINSVQSRPSETQVKRLPVNPSDYPGNLSPDTILKLQQCEINPDTMELCMRCAKVTKSEIIYPLCCNNDDETKDWCHRYVYYGTDEGL